MADSTSVLRVIIDPPASGAWNMAVDETLLVSDGHDGLTLRFYQWEEPTLSLGYFQSLAERADHPPSMNCPVVRRASGGGAIVHDQELTYSLVAPVSQRFGSSAQALYDVVHESLCDVLSDWKISAQRFALDSSSLIQLREPFLCFQRRSPGDVVLAGAKIAGSAQRRHLSRLLQHGSVLLARSDSAPELPGLAELAQAPPDVVDLQEAWLARLAQLLRVVAKPSTLTAAEMEAARAVEEGKFKSPKWTAKR